MNKVLLLTYWYPPKQAIGALRLAKWAKYLPEFGWEPVVITVQPRSTLYTQHGALPDELRVGRVYRTRDWSLNEILFALTTRFRRRRTTSAQQPSSSASPLPVAWRRMLTRLGYAFYKQVLCFPDEVWPWLFEYATIEAIARQEQPAVVVSSSLPNTTHLLAARLARRLRLPWIADFRDLWTQNHVFRRLEPLYTWERLLEQRTLRYAAALVTVSEPLREQLAWLHAKPVYVITNGFDPSDYPQPQIPPSSSPEAPLQVLYTGRIYPGKRDPTPLFQALATLRQQGNIAAEDVKVLFYGHRLEVVRQLLQPFPEVEPMVELHAPVPHKEALRLQQQADVLLLLEWVDPRAKGVYTGKIFEYLGARRPILSIGYKEGVIARLLQETGAGVQVAQAKEIEPWIRQWLTEKRREGRPRWRGSEHSLRPYTRREQTRQLADLLAEVVKR